MQNLNVCMYLVFMDADILDYSVCVDEISILCLSPMAIGDFKGGLGDTGPLLKIKL